MRPVTTSAWTIYLSGCLSAFAGIAVSRCVDHFTTNKLDIRALETEVRLEDARFTRTYDHWRGGEFTARDGEDGNDGAWSSALVYDKDTRVAHVVVTRDANVRPRAPEAVAEVADCGRNEADKSADGSDDEIVNKTFHTGNYSKTQEEK